MNLMVPKAKSKDGFSFNGGLEERNGIYLSAWAAQLEERIDSAGKYSINCSSISEGQKLAIQQALEIPEHFRILVGRNHQHSPRMAPEQGYFVPVTLRINDGSTERPCLIYVPTGGKNEVITSDNRYIVLKLNRPHKVGERETLVFSDSDSSGSSTWFFGQ